LKNRYRIDHKLDEARQKEKDGDLKAAEKLYLKVLKTSSSTSIAYDRLMIIYRRQKDSRKEVEIIKQAIANFKTNYLERQKGWIERNEIAAGLSKDLAISLGLMDKEGLPVFPDPLLVKWQNRLVLLEKRMEKGKRAKKVKPPKSVKTLGNEKKSASAIKTKSTSRK